jgi:hypothetical protein
MHRFFAVVFSLTLLWRPSLLLACEFCGTPETLLCGCHGLMDGYSEGAEDPLEPFRTQGNGWTSTSSGPSGLGQSAALTWSIARNGTSLPSGLGEPPRPSNLITFLDTLHHGGPGPGGTDLTQRAWFPLVESAFERWDSLSGITFNYEPNDDGAALSSANAGILGRRGDHRLSGHSIDGQISPTFLAYNYFPNFSDMVIDTDEVSRYGNPEGNYIRFRNMLMHEIGHGLGLQHLMSANAAFLMEPFLATDFDGPQLDDILGIHRLYGDVNEKGAGNDNYINSTTLGRFWPGQSAKVGSDAIDTVVDFGEVDFLSIDGSSDIDFFRFTILSPSIIDLELKPLGPTYSEGPQSGLESPFNTATMSDLTLTLWDRDGTSILEFVNDGGLGETEELEDVFLYEPGDYYLSVAGAQNAAQFYELGLDVNLPVPTSSNIFGNIVQDFARRAGFGRFSSGPLANIFQLPEPSTLYLMAMCCGAFAVRRRIAR